MDFKNAPKIISKSSQNRPWGVPGGSLGVPRDLPEASREPSGWFMRRGENLRKIWSVPDTSRSPFWSPAGTPKSTKNWLVAQKGAPGNAFLSIFVANVVFLGFLVDFWSIFHEKSMKKQTCFFTTARVFFKLATPTKHCILRYESYFFVFWVFEIFLKKWSKIECKIGPRKTIKQMAQLGPKMVPKLIKSELENPENLQNGPKKYFFEGSIFWLFFWSIFSWIFGLLGDPGSVPKSSCFRLFSTFSQKPGSTGPRRGS